MVVIFKISFSFSGEFFEEFPIYTYTIHIHTCFWKRESSKIKFKIEVFGIDVVCSTILLFVLCDVDIIVIQTFA